MSGQMQKQKAIGLFIGFGAVFLIAPSGCAGLKLQMFDHSVHKPSNVAVYFSVETRNGQPVANLTPQDFRIYEEYQNANFDMAAAKKLILAVVQDSSAYETAK